MKLFASDYDGTLKINGHMSDENKQAIDVWRSHGNKFALVTGRSMESIQKEIEDYALQVDYIVGNNGGAVYDHEFHEINTHYFPFDQVLHILDYITSETSISYVLNDGFYRAKKVLDPKREDRKYAHTQTTKTVEELLEHKKIAQIVVSLDQDEDTKRIANYINANFAMTANAYRNVNCVDIAPYGVSKATGIYEILHQEGYDKNDVYAIGDSFNDIAMLETFFGIAMAHAPLQVKSYADMEATSVDQAIFKLLAQGKI